MNKKLLVGLAALLVVGGSLVLLKKKSVAPPQLTVANKPTFVIQETRKKDLGHKLKLDECLQQEKNEYILVDVDNNETYVFANLKQYFVGPHPIKEEDLVKRNILEFDKLPIQMIDCAKAQFALENQPQQKAEKNNNH